MPTSNPDFPGVFTEEQTRLLLAPINPRRVSSANGHSHVPGHEIIAHLIRIFGFGNFTYELLEPPTLVFEQQRPPAENVANQPWKWRWDVCYRASMRLTIFDEKHRIVAFYEDASTGDASNQTRADGHDLAMKSAITLAKKRCAVHLGDQFGLSLYNRGSMAAQILRSSVLPGDLHTELWGGGDQQQPPADPSEGIVQQEGLGIDERPVTQDPSEEQEARIAHSTGAAPRTTDGDR